MGSAAWLSSAVGVADTATQALGLQEPVDLASVGVPDTYGNAVPGVPVSHPALVQRKEGQMKTREGQVHSFQAIVTFLRPIAVSPGDRITLSDGITGPMLLPQGGMDDSATGHPFVRTVYIGGR
jgi:hypothetical protein